MSEIMTAYIVPVLLGIVSNALTSLLANHLPKISEENTNLSETIKKIIDELSQSFEWKGTLRAEEVCFFLDSPEVQQVVEQIFSLEILEAKTIEDIQKEFVLLFQNYFNEITEEDKINAILLFNLIQQTVLKVLIIKTEKLGFRDLLALINYGNNRIENIIRGLEKNLEFLVNRESLDINAINDFEKKYRRQVAERLRYIKLYNLDTTKRIPVDDIYVNPKINFRSKIGTQEIWNEQAIQHWKLSDIAQIFVGDSSSPTTYYFQKRIFDIFNTSNHTIKDLLEEISINENNFYSLINKTVVLGNPGGGKSTLTYKICSDLDKHYDKRLINNKLLTPIHITVRDYGEEKNKNNWSILQFIESVSNSSYQLASPNGAFEYLLHNGRAILIFDGLDELLDTSYRREIVDDIESFCNLYPDTPVLITSREIGYEQAPLNESIFQAYTLGSFDTEQIREYAENWFSLETELTKEEQKSKITSFLKESEIASDIRSNPLMLGLMCSIYRGENYIPQNRPDLYERCSVMLFEKWDKHRGINSNLQFEAHLKPGMMFLAHWIYTNENLQVGVKTNNLIEQTTNYLEGFYENRNEAEHIARKFVDFCKGRAWVFTDVGDGIYQFTHQTFLEYFTACHLIRTVRTAEKIHNELSTRIKRAEWDVVTQLSVQLLDKTFEGAADEVFNLLLNEIDIHNPNNKGEQINILLFIVRCTKFIVPTYLTKKRIVETCINFVTQLVVTDTYDPRRDPLKYNQRYPIQILVALLTINSENKESILNIAQNYLKQNIDNSNGKRLEVFIQIVNFFREDLDESVLQITKSKLKVLSDENKHNLLLKYEFKLISANKLFEKFGLEILFVGNYYSNMSTMLNIEFLIYLIFGSIEDQVVYNLKDRIKANNLLTSLGKYILGKGSSTIQINRKLIPSNLVLPSNFRNLPKNELFGAFIIFASIIESSYKYRNVLKRRIKDKSFLGGKLGYVFLGRGEESLYKTKIIAEISNSGLSDIQKEFIWKWIRKKVSFIKAD